MDVRVRCVAFYDQKLVLIHRIRPGRAEEFYFFPGGGVEDDELPESACIREMIEETSLVVAPTKLLGIQLHTDRNGDHCQMYYLVNVVEGTLAQGGGAEYSEDFINLHGSHDPVAITMDEFRNAPTIHPGRIREHLLPHIENLSDLPFFVLDDRTI